MRILVLGDAHIKTANLHSYSSVAEEIYAKIDELKPDLVVSLGDTLDTHERVHLECLCFAIKFYKEIAKKCKLFVLIGNHDLINNQQYLTGIHPFTGLENYPNITIVDKPVRYLDFVFVPFVPTKRFNEALTNVNLDGVKFLFAHQEFKGCRMKKIVSSSGDVWEGSVPIISGHIHEFQCVSNIVYVGSLMQNDYDESPDKALLLIEEQGYKRLYLNSIVRKVVVRLTTEQLMNFGSFLPPPSDQLLVKVIVTADIASIPALLKTPAYLACEKIVDKIVFEKTNVSASIASNMIREAASSSGTGAQDLSLEEIVKSMLKGDKETSDLFDSLLV